MASDWPFVMRLISIHQICVGDAIRKANHKARRACMAPKPSVISVAKDMSMLHLEYKYVLVDVHLN